MAGIFEYHGNILGSQRAVFHFFGLVLLLGALLIGVVFVNHWNKVGALQREVARLKKEVSQLEDKVKIVELKMATEELLNRPSQ